MMNALKLLSFILFEYLFSATSPIVDVKNGSLVGTVMQSRYGRNFFAYRGIPYALSPIGDLRFEPPRPAASWSGIRSARYDGNSCIQKYTLNNHEELFGDEDCLYLNIYTPKLPSLNDENEQATGLPVMIWLHGGGFDTGTGHSLFYGPKFLLDHDVVLVCVNYRLGALGFLSTEDMILPGNQGLKDQAQAIRWVNENIRAFGGDPNRVTLFGQSAGAASANLHMMSSLSKGLFHRVIGQSGTARCPWVYNAPGLAKNYAIKFGEFLNCPTDNTSILLKCLRQKSSADIVLTDKKFENNDYLSLSPFKPVIEIDHSGAFLTKEPIELIENNNWDDIPWLMGINSHEGGYPVAINEGKNDNFLNILNDNWIKLAPHTFLYADICPKEYQDEISKKIRKFYLNDKTIDESTKFDIINMLSDGVGFAYVEMSIRDHFRKKISPVYYYHFAYNGTATMGKRLGKSTSNYGVIHGDELQYLFPLAERFFSDISLTTEDNKMIDILTELWFNFANTGNPTPEITKNIPVKWTPVESEELEYLLIEKPNKLSMSKNLYPERIKFWHSLSQLRWTLDKYKNLKKIKDEL